VQPLIILTEPKAFATAQRNARTLARMMISEPNAAAYLRFADAYDALAEQQEQLAR
jgi:hypothetical protein